MKTKILISFLLLFVCITNTKASLLTPNTLDTTGVKGTILTTPLKMDSSTTIDSLARSTIVRVETFLQSMGIDNNNTYISKTVKKDFSKKNYRNFSNIFSSLPFSHYQDLGSLGQPSEQMFYGLGFGNISYNQDGVLLNNRWQNSYALNKLSGERIDSVEIIPITRSFLYSVYNNPVTISMTSKFKFSNRPTTYLRFYQASFDEGFVDAFFHLPINRKLAVGIGITNHATDSRFSNTDYDSWKINATVHYKASDKINIVANYLYSYDTLALFGGLDTNKLLNDNYSTVLYGFDLGTRKSSRYQLTYNNNANIKILAHLAPQLKTDLTFYLNSSSQKFVQNKEELFDKLPSFVHSNFYNTIGVRLRNIYAHPFVSLDIIANYEETMFNSDVSQNISKQSILTFSGKMNFLMISNNYFVPSVFAKKTGYSYSTRDLFSFGTDVSGLLSDAISYYAGISWVKQQPSILAQLRAASNYRGTRPSDNKAIEFGMKFKSESVFAKLSYFIFESKNRLFPYITHSSGDSILVNEGTNFNYGDIKNSGVNISLNLNLWDFVLTNNTSYYFNTREERRYASPDYTSAGRFYYHKHLFNNNLYLQTGINYGFSGGQLPVVYDFEKSLQITNGLTPLVHYNSVPASLQLNLFLSATIQNDATIFVTLENMLNTEYYIVPYYFKQPITLRFGVSWVLYD